MAAGRTGRVLVTGGAGYVGSHCARRLAAEGFEVVTLDDLSSGYREAVVGELVCVDLRDRSGLGALLSRRFDCVLHFASLINVGESVHDPLGYYDVNVGGALALLSAMATHGCDALVFSSSCAVYGAPTEVPISEGARFAPISPYGATKTVVEDVLALERQAGRLRSVSLRYFNACGASEDGWLGEAHDPELHVIPLALAAAESGRSMPVFGVDHPTPDGTCVRDYVHVLDLAEAHVAAVRLLIGGARGGAYNLGTGQGASVYEVLDTVAAVTGRPVHRTLGARRDGDPPALVADPARAQAELGWRARYGLPDAVRTAWQWYRAPRFGPRSR
jgi:UDP-glucose-4-epimerase GalE